MEFCTAEVFQRKSKLGRRQRRAEPSHAAILAEKSRASSRGRPILNDIHGAPAMRSKVRIRGERPEVGGRRPEVRDRRSNSPTHPQTSPFLQLPNSVAKNAHRDKIQKLSQRCGGAEGFSASAPSSAPPCPWVTPSPHAFLSPMPSPIQPATTTQNPPSQPLGILSPKTHLATECKRHLHRFSRRGSTIGISTPVSRRQNGRTPLPRRTSAWKPADVVSRSMQA